MKSTVTKFNLFFGYVGRSKNRSGRKILELSPVGGGSLSLVTELSRCENQKQQATRLSGVLVAMRPWKRPIAGTHASLRPSL